MALLKRNNPMCACQPWFLWLVLIVGIILAVAEMGYLDLMGLTWGPVVIVLFALGCLLGKK